MFAETKMLFSASRRGALVGCRSLMPHWVDRISLGEHSQPLVCYFQIDTILSSAASRSWDVSFRQRNYNMFIQVGNIGTPNS